VGSEPEQTDIEVIFAEALNRFDLLDRIAFLDRACGRDTDLRHYVDGLFRVMEETEDLPRPPLTSRSPGTVDSDS
jgi:hypothetical protein